MLVSFAPSLQGKWELLYSSVEQFRSSPFFWAFQEGLVQVGWDALGPRHCHSLSQNYPVFGLGSGRV